MVVDVVQFCGVTALPDTVGTLMINGKESKKQKLEVSMWKSSMDMEALALGL